MNLFQISPLFKFVRYLFQENIVTVSFGSHWILLNSNLLILAWLCLLMLILKCLSIEMYVAEKLNRVGLEYFGRVGISREYKRWKLAGKWGKNPEESKCKLHLCCCHKNYIDILWSHHKSWVLLEGHFLFSIKKIQITYKPERTERKQLTLLFRATWKSFWSGRS